MNKKCFKCKLVKPISEFYKHKEMKDGYLNKCILCTKRDVRRRYYEPESRQKIREYERSRFKTAHRKELVANYQRKHRKLYPDKMIARDMVNNGKARGKLKSQPCSICGSVKSEAHHSDYSQPLKVEWLCFKHHRELHGQIIEPDRR